MSAPKIPIALVTNTLPPYRKHVHLRVVRELPQLCVWTVRTHAEDDRWKATTAQEAEELGLVSVDADVSTWKQGRPRQWGKEWRVGGRIISVLRREKVRAVVLAGYNDPARLRILLWCKLHGVPLLVWGDSNINDDIESLKGRPFKALAKKIFLVSFLKLSAGAFSIGTAGKPYFEKYGISPDRIFSFPYEIDYQAIRSLSIDAVVEARQRYGLCESRRRMLFCGRLVPEKRADLAIDAFVAIAERRPLWDLVVLGDGKLRAGLEARVPAHLLRRVMWTGHVSDQNIVYGIQGCCDVLVMPSDVEPWGLVINEAMTAGLAIVSSSVAGAAVDLVRDGVNGRLFPPGNQSALEICLLDVTEPGRLDAMRKQSPVILANWIKNADPVDGLHEALKALGVMAQPAGNIPSEPK